MIEAIEISEENKWNEIVTSFMNYDVYYLRTYVYPFHIIGDGVPILLFYHSVNLRGMCLLMKREIWFKDIELPSDLGQYYDLITPYGYGGFLFEGLTDDASLKEFYDEYNAWLSDNKIVSVFYRFHPQLKTAQFASHYCNLIQLGHTIEMDLSSPEIIWSNISSKNRNMIRKAQKNGITIEHGKSWELFKSFICIYNETMEKDHAEDYYFFPESFYKCIYDSMKGNCELFYAIYNGKIISTAIMLYANKRMHYHLSGSVLEYRNLAPSNLMLYDAAKWGYENGLKTFHLGGGVGSLEDNLFNFKKEFNRKSDVSFYIGKQICNLEIYDQLVEFRRSNDTKFDVNSHFFPLYRAL